MKGGSFLACCAGVLVAGHAIGQAVQFKATPVVSGLAYPLNVTSAPGDPTRLFVIEQRGKIRVVDVSATGTYSLRATPLVDLTSQLSSTYLEYGVLGLAWHPDWVHNGFFYVVFTPTTIGDWTLLRFKTAAGNPNVADMSTQTTILRFSYTITQHRAGWIAFGQDGYLYGTTGDGGENDPSNAGADPTVLKGKVLRIDVNGPDGIPGTADDDGFPADALKNYRIPASNPFVANPPVANAAQEIWAYGLRNPWRASLDRLTGDLWIGDVGQNAWEEIDYAPAGVGGRFFGWRCLEGTHATNLAGCTGTLPPSIPPAFEYPHGGTGVASGSSVTGGYVYRGCAMPSVRGTYFFGDWGGKVWTATPSNGVLTNVANRTAELAAPGTLVSFGEDTYGELYFVNWGSTNGAVYKIEPRTLDGADCNANAKPDLCDIARGVSLDTNGNGIPDECEFCAADFNHDTALSSVDIFEFLEAWFNGDSRTDFDHSGILTQQDIYSYIGVWFVGC